MVVEGFLSVSAEDTQLVECYKTTLKMKWVEGIVLTGPILTTKITTGMTNLL